MYTAKAKTSNHGVNLFKSNYDNCLCTHEKRAVGI